MFVRKGKELQVKCYLYKGDHIIKDCLDLPSARKATRLRRIDKVKKRNSP